MNRSLYSGVSGLKAHQTRMDVIGNNISNVNTYGFKASRVTFRDVYYQAINAGSAGSSTSGGTNPGAIGYGTQVGSVDLLMGQSSFTMTDSSMDLAIDGEGFFQVQDADGNKFYTRSGSLTFDSAGNLVDSQGNFVLGISGDPLGKSTGSNLIQLSLPSVTPSGSSVSTTINDVIYTLSTSNYTAAGNISMQLIQGTGMTDGVKATAQVGTNGIVVTLNANESFSSLDDLNTAINDAIETYMQDSTGASHPAGNFTISMNPADAGNWPLTGEDICSTDFALQSGEATDWPATTIGGGFSPTGTTGSTFGSAFSTGANALEAFNVEYDSTAETMTVTMTINGESYTGVVDSSKTEAGTMKLTNGSSSSDYIIMNRPGYSAIVNAMKDANSALVDGSGNLTDGTWDTLSTAGVTPGDTTFTAAAPSDALGLSGSKMVLSGGTEGGAQGIESLTGVAVSADGSIIATHAQLGEVVVGQINLVTFANPEGLVQSSGTYFTTSANSGEMSYCQPGTSGSGKLVSGSLELSNVDLSKEFSDMITTQRGYQACSRLITVSDEMLEELVNLKR
ncbi:flagellar hook protein FlgE [Oscillospiraceae bacterium LTW-04]|nr:flagellar hook-basal body complex protein [Oscillospiraceae bacterium MB24-C1]